MKKLLLAIALATSTTSANALGISNYIGRPQHTSQYSVGYHHGKSVGYHQGKSDAYNNVARTLVIGGMVVIAGVIIYKLGQDSRWTANENGVVYRF